MAYLVTGIFFATLLYGNLVTAGTEDWSLVELSPIYRDLDTCARDCVLTVNTKIFDIRQNTTCRSQGCVCSDSTQGENYLNGEAYVISCAQKSCSSSDKVKSAQEAFGNLCNMHNQNSSRPQTSPSKYPIISSKDYWKLSPCAKFLLNGCFTENGERNEPSCGPLLKTENWEKRGSLSKELNCTTYECMCRGSKFSSSTCKLVNDGAEFCSMYPSTEAVRNEELDDMLRVLAEDCVSQGYIAKNATCSYLGDPPGTKDDSAKKEATRDLAIGVTSAVISALSLIFAVSMWWLMQKAEKRAKSAHVSIGKVKQ